MVDLKKNISFKGLTKKTQETTRPTELPQKNSINLAQGVAGTQNRRLTLLAFAAAVIVILLLCKLFVVDVLATGMSQQAQVSAMEAELKALVESNKAYDQVSEEYAQYVISDLNEEEIMQVDRDEVVQLIRSYLLKVGDLLSLQVAGNTITANVSGVNMADVSAQMQRIQMDPLVSGASVTTAQGLESSLSKNTVHTIVITLVGEEPPTADAPDPSNDTVYEALTGDDLDD
ncbi:MAG: hypothetical protein Q4D06_04560 [Coriobacteriia bacterium]|nr:hypothetical protein [Coriobacteriia bacterium]